MGAFGGLKRGCLPKSLNPVTTVLRSWYLSRHFGTRIHSFMGLHPWSRGNGIKRAHLLAGIILVFGIIVAGGVLAFSGFSVSEPIAGVESPQWTQESGAGITVPACGSTTACGAPGQNVVCTTCSGNAPSVEFTWTNTGDTATLTCSTVRIGAWVTGFPAVRILDNLPCNGSATWTGAANPTNYNY